MPEKIEIIQAATEQHFEEARALFLEYQNYLNIDLCFQDFEKECKDISVQYDSPSGCLLLCFYSGELAGCVALRKFKNDICEMKRLYIRTAYRGKGLGKRLSEKIIEEAKRLGYSAMRLDTFDYMKEALNIYKSLGFKEIASYRYNPSNNVVYLELKL